MINRRNERHTPSERELPIAGTGRLHPRHGIHKPTSGTPARVPGSVRRTATVDMLRPEGVDGPLVLRGHARDLRTGADGTPNVLRDAAMTATVDHVGGGLLTALVTTPDRPALAPLIGRSAGSGFRGAVLAADPALPGRCNPLYQLLDDVPVTTLISGVAATSERRRRGEPTPYRRISPFGRDMCAGYADGGTIMNEIDEVGRPPMVTGPVAGEVRTDDPWAWHELPQLPPHSMRRARRTDVLPGTRTRVDVFYRDSYVRADGLETVVHEYTVELELEDGAVHSIRAVPRVLPWVECPVAAASANRLTGLPLSGLRRHVRSAFQGTSTCTHLNDTLRSLEDVPALLADLFPGERSTEQAADTARE